MSARSVLTEYLTLNEALAASARVDAGERASAARAFESSREKRHAAECLLIGGSLADAVRSGAESAKLAATAFEHLREPPDTRFGRAVKALGDRATALGDAPALDRDVTGAQVVSLRGLLAAAYRLERHFESKLLDRRGLVRLRVTHWLRAAACMLFVFVAVRFGMAIVLEPRAQATSEANAMYGAERAVDGDPDTEWSAKDRSDQWLELAWRMRRRVRTIKLMNGHARFDRATSRVRVELYDSARLVRTVDGAFDGTPTTSFLMLDGAGARCDRIRIFTTSEGGREPALAEVIVE